MLSSSSPLEKGARGEMGEGSWKKEAVFVCVNVVYIFSFSEGEKEREKKKTNLESSP